MSLFPNIQNLVSTIDMETIPAERRAVLQKLVDYIQDKQKASLPIRLNFICTHNSRRSHLSQVWAQTMAYHFNLPNVHCYSSGTERTALFPMIAKTLINAGFEIHPLSVGSNPVYSIKYTTNAPPVIGFSKTIEDDFNPKSEFAAIMTCSQADEGCPFVPGAEKRIPITFDDPKVFDNTPQQAEKYAERSMQIASEMFYVFSQIEK